MSLKVCKFGGTSMADAAAIGRIGEIVRSDAARRYVVVSAPGKRNKADAKITDLLYACQREAEEKGNCKETFRPVAERFLGICRDLGLKEDGIREALAATEKEIAENADSAEFAASRGEYLGARVMAEYLGYEFVDAADVIRFDSSGNFSAEYTNDRMVSRLQRAERAVIPGFYGRDPHGRIRTFSRGGSDITGSIVARAAGADVYENWTDVSGCLVADPRIVDSPKVISSMTYKELRELSYMGASVLHADAIFPVRKARIPINIRNTFAPDDDGTTILPGERYEDGGSLITGIAGRKNFTVIFIEKAMMNNEVGFARKVLSVLENHGISLEHMPSGIDTMSVVADTSEVSSEDLDAVCDEIRESAQPDFMRVVSGISLVATVGHGMARKAGVSARLFGALAREKINIRLIDQGSSELNIIVGVDDKDYEKAVRAIYREFVG